MRTTITLDDKTLSEAGKLTGVKERPLLIQRALETLISLEKSKRLAALGGSERQLAVAPRRRAK